MLERLARRAGSRRRRPRTWSGWTASGRASGCRTRSGPRRATRGQDRQAEGRRTRLAYKPEHAVDLDTGAIVAAAIHAADRGDTATLPETLEAAEANLAAVDAAPTVEDPTELVADKGYHSRDGLKELEDGAWKSRIAEKKVAGVSRWHGDEAARRAVYNNRARLRSGVAKEAFRLRAELVERGFALTLDRGGMRRAWLRGRENLAQALPRARRRLQPRAGHAPAGRCRHAEGVPGRSISAPDAPHDHRRRSDRHPRRCRRHRGRDARRQLRARPARLKLGFVNALLNCHTGIIKILI
jgi:hypothetical protein